MKRVPFGEGSAHVQPVAVDVDAKVTHGRDRGEIAATSLCVSSYELDSGVPVEPH